MWNSNFLPMIGGLEVITAELAFSLRDGGCEVEILAPSPGPSSYRGIPVHRLPFTEPENFQDPSRLRSLTSRVAEVKREVAPDVIHLNGVSAYLSLHLLSRKAFPARDLLTLHGSWSMNADPLASTSVRTVDAVATCSAYARRFVLQRIPSAESKVHLVTNALPRKETHVQGFPQSARLLVLGRLSPEKGFDLAVRAFATLRGEFPELELVVAGSGNQDRSLEQQAEDLGVAEKVRFLGEVARSEIGALMQSCSIVLVPSRVEGFGLTALEAAQNGRPVVASRVGGLPEIVEQNCTGILVAPDDHEALVTAVRRLLLSPDEREAMGQRAHAHAESNFRWDRFVDRYRHLYQGLLA